MAAERRREDIAIIAEALTKGEIDQLDDSLKEKHRLLSAADDLMRIHGHSQRAIRMLAGQHNISYAKAKDLMIAAEKFFGSQKMFSKDYWKVVGLDWMIQLITANRKRIFVVDQNGDLTDQLKDGIGPKDIDSYAKLQREFLRILGGKEENVEVPTDAMPEVILVSANPEDIGLKRVDISINELRDRFQNIFIADAKIIEGNGKDHE